MNVWSIKVIFITYQVDDLVCFLGMSILWIKKTEDLDEKLSVLINSDKCAAAELAAVCTAKVYLLYEFL